MSYVQVSETLGVIQNERRTDTHKCQIHIQVAP